MKTMKIEFEDTKTSARVDELEKKNKELQDKIDKLDRHERELITKILYLDNKIHILTKTLGKLSTVSLLVKMDEKIK